jgi:hypothetical protein
VDVDMLEDNTGTVLDPDGELDTYIYVANVKLNRSEKLNLEIVYTSYRGASQIQVKLSCRTGNSKISENAKWRLLGCYAMWLL